MKFVEKTDWGSYWMDEKFDENLTIRCELVDCYHNSEQTKESLEKLDEKSKEYEGFNDPMKIMWDVTKKAYLDYKKDKDGEFIDTELVETEVLYDGEFIDNFCNYEDAYNFCVDWRKP
tara:strand:- start:98 stop:451 length:354 start_codon:yes stop_codon:yes gene_type:complete